MIRRGMLCLAMALWPAVSSAACVTRQLTRVPLEITGTVILAPVTVNGIAGRFVLDTGSAVTLVTPDAVSRFGLALDEWTATTMLGVGGIERRRNANPRSIAIGGVALRRRSLAGDATLRVGTLAPEVAGEVAGEVALERRVDGLLGRDFLSAFDLDADFPNATLTLYDVQDCSGRFLPWSVDYISVPVESPAANALVVLVELDGVPLRALLDTGASRTLVAAPGMARLGLGLQRLRNDPSHVAGGLGPHTVTVWQHKFGLLRVGSETFADPAFPVTPIRLPLLSDMLLGADLLVGRRVWISYATHQLFMVSLPAPR